MAREHLPTIDPHQLGHDLSGAVIRLRRALQRSVRQEMHDRPLSTAEVELLVLVAARPGIGVASAASELRTAPNTISTLLRNLLVAGYVRRDLDAHDRRVANLSITPAGEARLARWRQIRAELLDRALVDFSDRDRGTLAAAVPLLDHLSANFEARRAPSAPRHSATGA
jgi:DNA-binding MarR family transcriptional regulator